MPCQTGDYLGGIALLSVKVKSKNTAPLLSNQESAVLTPAELKAIIPKGHEIVMMLDTKAGCRIFTSSKRGDDAWEHEVLIPSDLLIRRVGCAIEFGPNQSRSFHAA